MTLFALVDCNNFYVSCERAFNPSLEKRPVIVLSNNDGCVISRSNEAKKLGIPMGAPFFEWKYFCKKNNVAVFSSNYELYGDMSHRIMMLLREHCFSMEVYSIDEAFLVLDSAEVLTEAYALRQRVQSSLGLPISIGISKTKTLAKMANHIAKNKTTKGVFYLNHTNLISTLRDFPVEKIWRIGRKLAIRLNGLGIYQAHQLYEANAKQLRVHFNVVLEKVVQEIQGVSCLSLELVQPRKQIICSRSFGRTIYDLASLEEAVSHYAANAALKLRKQKSVMQTLSVFLQTNVFDANTRRDQSSVAYTFQAPTADTAAIIKMAKKCTQELYQPRGCYHKAGIILLDILPASFKQQDMFASGDMSKRENLMETIDKINAIKGKNSVFYCAEGIEKKWKMRSNLRSPCYTTKWDELPKVK